MPHRRKGNVKLREALTHVQELEGVPTVRVLKQALDIFF